jgi:colicin import membrane protein
VRVGRQLSAEHTQLCKAHEADGAANDANEAEMTKIMASQTKAQVDVDKAKAKAAEAAATASASAAAAAEKQAAYEAAMGLGSASSGEGAKNLQAQLSEAGSEASACETAMKTAEMRKKQFAKEASETKKKLAEAEKSGGKQQKEHHALAAEVADMSRQMEALAHDEGADAEMSRALSEKQRAAADAGRKERELASQVAGIDFKYADPTSNFDREQPLSHNTEPRRPRTAPRHRRPHDAATLAATFVHPC